MSRENGVMEQVRLKQACTLYSSADWLHSINWHLCIRHVFSQFRFCFQILWWPFNFVHCIGFTVIRSINHENLEFYVGDGGKRVAIDFTSIKMRTSCLIDKVPQFAV